MQKNGSQVEAAIRDGLVSTSEADSTLNPANVVDGLFAIARAMAFAAKHLGKEEASGPQGCLEFLAGKVEDGAARIAESIDGLADAVNRLAACSAKE